MALNPPINQDGQPMRVEGEYFAMLRKDMEIEIKIPGWSKLTAKGKVNQILLDFHYNIVLALCYYCQNGLCKCKSLKRKLQIIRYSSYQYFW